MSDAECFGDESRAADPRADGGGARAAVELSGIRRTYRPGRGRDALDALTGLSLSVGRGEFVAVIGPSGCGKSTLLELICGLQEPDEGSCRADPAVLMPQTDALLPWASAIDNAALPLRIAGLGRAEARERARPWFRRLGLEEFESATVQSMSGGMRQRLSFLRTLLADKPVLCLDEPFGALDALTRLQTQAWLAQALADPGVRGHTVVLVTHDVDEAVSLADRVAVLSPRPGQVIRMLTVDAERPRKLGDPRLTELRVQALAALGVST